MLKRIDIREIDLENGYFHFTNKDNIKNIAKNNLLPMIGKNSYLIEETEKIFFSVGASNILKTHDVWLKWLMNRLFGSYSLSCNCDNKTYDEKIKIWINEFLSKKYQKDTDKKDILFNKYYEEMSNNIYLNLNLSKEIDFSENDYDEVKLRLSKNKDNIDYAFLQEMYGSYSNLDIMKMDSWNMHTFKSKCIGSKDVNVVTYNKKDVAVIDMLKYIYNKYKDIDYDLLDDFMIWLDTK